MVLLDEMKDWKDNVHFILVEPKEPGNIGAAARAIKNMGFKNLSLVHPSYVITDEALRFAHGAADVLESAVVFNSLKDSVRDKSIIIGTSRRKGRRRGVFVPAEPGAQRLFQIARSNRTGILFGREDRGLFNEEVEECGFLMTIPSSKKQPSLNLAHAVLIIAYELSKAEYTTADSTLFFPGLVDNEELSALYERIEKTLKLLEYIPHGRKNLSGKIIQNLKHLVGRSGLTDWEMKMFHGICSQIEKKITGHTGQPE